MGSRFTCTTALLCLFLVAFVIKEVRAADPELLTDFMPPPGVSPKDLNGSFFTSTVLRNRTVNPGPFSTVKLADKDAFPALDGLGVSVSLVTFPPGTVTRPHTHPRATEVFFVIEGTLDVWLVDSAQNVFTNTIHPGDVFVFPRGLVHVQINRDPNITVQGLASFSSSSPGVNRLPGILFGSGIDAGVLAESFEVSEDVINQLVEAQK